MKSTSFYLFFKIAIVCLITGGFVGCNSQSETSDATESGTTPTTTSTELPVFEKLLGTWQSENGKNFERWIKTGEHTYHSSVFSVKGADTSWNEQANIYQENNSWIYENQVSDQNNGQAIKFVAPSVSPNAVQFSNPAHDFPTDVCYTVPDANTVHAFIIGPNAKGGKDTIPFDYKRVK